MVDHPPSLELALLGFVIKQPLHGYEIHRHLADQQALGMIWSMKQAHCYALLRRLEERGYLTALNQQAGKRPPRKLLHLTNSGRMAFFTWLTHPVAHGRDFRQEFLAKLYFIDQLGDTVALATLVQQQRRVSTAFLDDLHTQAAQAALPPFELTVLQFRMSQIASVLNWLDTVVGPSMPQERQAL